MMKATMPIVTRKRKDARGRILSYEAQMGQVTAAAVTEQDAVESCQQAVLSALDRLSKRPVIGTVYGQVYVVFPTLYGWGTWCQAYSSTDYYTEQGESLQEAVHAIVRHLACCIWTHEQPDDQAFVDGVPVLTEREKKELLAQLQWYREMRRLQAKGYSDTQARNIIGGYEKETMDGAAPTPVRPD